MGSVSDENDQFFESKEYVTTVSDSGSDGVYFSDIESRVVEDVVRNSGYEVWTRTPGTINERRQKLLKMMGLDQKDDGFVDNARFMEGKWAVLRSRIRELRTPGQASVSRCSTDTQELFDIAVEENLVRRIRNFDDEQNTFEGFFEKSPLGQNVMTRDVGVTSNKSAGNRKAVKRWLEKLGVVASVADTMQEGTINHAEAAGSLPNSRPRNHIVKVRSYRKRSKEFSALYMEQDIVAHKDAILTMKFSPDGQFLASAGEDEIVRIWQVIESQRSDLVHVPNVDSSHVYFEANHLGELEPASVSKPKKSRLKSLRKSWESACVIFPQTVFQLAETPLHEFEGHCSEILDLSWSNSKNLLSSSADKTVRLWRVGFDQCIKVFSHNSFVTCVQFNPVDENYFISGSVDGKVRIWSISRCEVVDWADIKEIVTAVCYKPDGKGAIVGSIAGDCYFYDTSENRLHMTNQTSLHGKKKTPNRRITGFQYSPGDPNKLIVTMADSQVRILKGVDVICKYKGLRNAGSQISASFATDGTQLISASEDSFVYVWSYANNTDGANSSQDQSKLSCERFFSTNASVAIPWCATPTGNNLLSLSATSPTKHSGIMVRYATEDVLEQHSPTDNPPHRSVSLGDSFPRGVATWPEEELTRSNSLTLSSSTCLSEFKFLKTTCYNMSGSSHAWGSVILTASWDGRIRVFQNYGLPVRL